MPKQGENHIPSPYYNTLFKLIETNIQMSKIEFFTHEFVRQVFEDEEIDLTTILEEDTESKLGFNRSGLNQEDGSL